MMVHFHGKDVELQDIYKIKKDGKFNGQDLASLKKYQEIIYIFKTKILNNLKSLLLWPNNYEEKVKYL